MNEKYSSFNNWWYFDTNCLSELAKLNLNGYSANVENFLFKRDVLISSSVLKEMRKVPNLLKEISRVLKCANAFVIPDLTKFWYTDFVNFLNVDDIQINSLGVFIFKPELVDRLLDQKYSDFEDVCKQSENDVAARFIKLVTLDIGAHIDERDLCVIIWQKVSKFSKLWFEIEIPHNECNAINFPSFYIYYYAYYFKFIKNVSSKPNNNDFVDLSNCLAAPYCERFYCDAKYASMLQREIKNRQPPTAFQLIKKLYNQGLVTKEDFEESRKVKNKLSKTGPLLNNTDIFSFSEMRNQILQ